MKDEAKPKQIRPERSNRRALTGLDKARILAGFAVCWKCKEPLGTLADIDFHHKEEFAILNNDALENIVPVHRDICHKILTHGTKGRYSGSSRHKVAQARIVSDLELYASNCMTREETQQQQSLMFPKPQRERSKHKIASRPFPKKVKHGSSKKGI